MLQNKKGNHMIAFFCCCRRRSRTFTEWLVQGFMPKSPPSRQEGMSASFITPQCFGD